MHLKVLHYLVYSKAWVQVQVSKTQQFVSLSILKHFNMLANLLLQLHFLSGSKIFSIYSTHKKMWQLLYLLHKTLYCLNGRRNLTFKLPLSSYFLWLRRTCAAEMSCYYIFFFMFFLVGETMGNIFHIFLHSSVTQT